GTLRPVAIVHERPLRVRHAELQGTARFEYTEALAEQVPDWLGVIEMLEAMFRENQAATVRFEGESAPQVECDVASGQSVHIEEPVFPESSAAQIQPRRTRQDVPADVFEPAAVR